MASLFKKLIRRELGETSYNSYFDFFRKSLGKKGPDTQVVFNDIVTKLSGRDIESLCRMQKRLNETLMYAYRINRTYIMLFLVYLTASLFLIAKNLNPVVTVVALILLSVCFVGKTYEFLVNKYCYIDARIVLIYKAALDKIAGSTGNQCEN